MVLLKSFFLNKHFFLCKTKTAYAFSGVSVGLRFLSQFEKEEEIPFGEKLVKINRKISFVSLVSIADQIKKEKELIKPKLIEQKPLSFQIIKKIINITKLYRSYYKAVKAMCHSDWLTTLYWYGKQTWPMLSDVEILKNIHNWIFSSELFEVDLCKVELPNMFLSGFFENIVDLVIHKMDENFTVSTSLHNFVYRFTRNWYDYHFGQK